MSVLHEIGYQWVTKNHRIPDPGTGGTFKQNDIAYGLAVVGAGTYKLPDGGVPMYVQATGTVTITSAASVTVAVIYSGQIALCMPLTSTTWASNAFSRGGSEPIPNAKYTTSSAASGVVPTGAVWSGASEVFWENTTDGAMAVTTPEASDWVAALQLLRMPVNMRYILTIINRGNNTITITGGTDVTITGEATIATLVTRRYLVSIDETSLTVVMISLDKGTIET